MTNLLYPICFIVLMSTDHFPGYDAEPIQGGQLDQGNEVIWLISYQRKGIDGTYKHACGGSIISDRHIITAAHCFVRFREGETEVWDGTVKTRIVIGTNDLNSTENPGNRLKVDKVIIPKEYTRLPGKIPIHDIAVIKIKHRIDFSRNIGKYGLIDLFNPKDESERKKYDGKEGFVAGFGQTKVTCESDGTRTYESDRLRNILPVQITDVKFCAGVPGLRCIQYVKDGEQPRGVGPGDSGGPLYYKSDNKFELVGVISQGPHGCDIRTSIGRFAKVMLIPDHKDFLDKALSLDMKKTFPEMSVEDFEETGNNYIVLPDQVELARKFYVEAIENKEAKKRPHSECTK